MINGKREENETVARNKKPRQWLRRKVGAQFLQGLLVVVPIGIALWVLVWLFGTIDSFLQPAIKAALGRTIPGAGLGITILLIYVAGVLTENVVGRRLIRYGEAVLAKVPIFRYVYTGIKDLIKGLSMPGKGGFSQVVLVEFPLKGMHSIGFATGETRGEDGERLLNVFIPLAPNPTSGFVELVKEENVVHIDMSIEDAIKMIVSAGAFSPPEFKAKSKD